MKTIRWKIIIEDEEMGTWIDACDVEGITCESKFTVRTEAERELLRIIKENNYEFNAKIVRT